MDKKNKKEKKKKLKQKNPKKRQKECYVKLKLFRPRACVFFLEFLLLVFASNEKTCIRAFLTAL